MDAKRFVTDTLVGGVTVLATILRKSARTAVQLPC
jgi:hypothetical protein